MKCKFCGKPLNTLVIDLGHMPLANSLLNSLNEPETHYPLSLYVCEHCWLVQLGYMVSAEDIFSKTYAYHSSQSPANIRHSKDYADMVHRKDFISCNSEVLEIGSNDGYMLQHFKSYGCSVLGIDPAEDAAEVAIKKGIPTIIKFFNLELAKSLNKKFDLICGINVLAHQPDIKDFVLGLKESLAEDGVITFEFPHLVNLIENCQFDTIYHEHYYYFSFHSICNIFHSCGLYVFDVEEIPEHGGSLRIYAGHYRHKDSQAVAEMYEREKKLGVCTREYYDNYVWEVFETRSAYNSFLGGIVRRCTSGERICAYGAAAKAATFFNVFNEYNGCIDFITDRSPIKQGKYMPGSHIKIVSEEYLKEAKPNSVLITAWNLKDEIMESLSYIREWGGKFIVAMPEWEIL